MECYQEEEQRQPMTKNVLIALLLIVLSLLIANMLGILPDLVPGVLTVPEDQTAEPTAAGHHGETSTEGKHRPQKATPDPGDQIIGQ